MALNMTRSNLISGLLFLAAIIVALAFILNSMMSGITTPSSKQQTVIEIEEHEEQQLFHGAIGDGTGCAACHTQPITSGSCTSAECHPSPPTTIGTNNDIDFPHHDYASGGPTDDCSLNICHDCAGDFRYVTIVDADHTYCANCHTDYTHSQPT